MEETKTENKMIEMSTKVGDLPMEGTLCAFKTKDKKLIFLGSLFFKDKDFYVKLYGKTEEILADKFDGFQYILNENGGFYFLNNK